MKITIESFNESNASISTQAPAEIVSTEEAGGTILDGGGAPTTASDQAHSFEDETDGGGPSEQLLDAVSQAQFSDPALSTTLEAVDAADGGPGPGTT